MELGNIFRNRFTAILLASFALTSFGLLQFIQTA